MQHMNMYDIAAFVELVALELVKIHPTVRGKTLVEALDSHGYTIRLIQSYGTMYTNHILSGGWHKHEGTVKLGLGMYWLRI